MGNAHGARGAIALALYAAVVHPRLMRWGATAEEAARTLPGDEVLAATHGVSTMGTTIGAPPAEVWPWLVQMGCGRGGWYSWDRLDNGGVPSADRIMPEHQDLREGDRLPSTPSGSHWFLVARIDPGRALVLRAPLAFPSGRPFDPAAGPPRWRSDTTWAFALSELPGGHTRLLVRTRGSGRPGVPLRLGSFLFWDPVHWLMQTRQLRNLRLRAESAVDARG